MNPLVLRTQELNWQIEHVKAHGLAGLAQLYLEQGIAYEALAIERMAVNDPSGWIDWLAAITAYALGGNILKAKQMWEMSHNLAATGRKDVQPLLEQHKELLRFIEAQQGI